MKRNKAAGVDGIRAEHILDASEVLLNPLVQTFNQLLNKGVPPAWCTGQIHPIFKAGVPEDAGDYRGTTVVRIPAELYAMVLEIRASGWAEHRKCRAKGQAGFRKDHHTSDQVFIIQALVRQAKQQNRKLYCCFANFKKAFDLQSIYAADKACVLTRDGPTDLFDCGIGVKQGCPASPLLFGLFLDAFDNLLEASPGNDAPHLADILPAILLFADDIALFSYSASGLQKQLDVLPESCAAREVTVNVNTTKILVFEHRKSTTPVFLHGERDIEQVDEFKYLGMLMHGTKGLSPAIDLLCKAARRAIFGMQHRCQQLSIHDPVLKCKLFDTLVRPILCCAAKSGMFSGAKRCLMTCSELRLGLCKYCLGFRSIQRHSMYWQSLGGTHCL